MIIEAFKPPVPREITIDDKITASCSRWPRTTRHRDRPQGPERAPHVPPIGWRLDIEDSTRSATKPARQRDRAAVQDLRVRCRDRRAARHMGINSPAAFEGVEADDLVSGGFTAEEAATIIARVAQK